jgi:phosphate transport system ATP-binding protein
MHPAQGRRARPEFLLRRLPGPEAHRHADLRQARHRADRPSGCGKSTSCAASTACTTSTRATATRARSVLHPDNTNLLARGRSDRGAHALSHGVPEAESLPQVDLRERRLRPARARHQQARTRRKVESALKGAALWNEVKDRLQEQAQPLRRPAAAPVHRPRAGDRSRDPALRRADLGARPDRHRQHRGAGAELKEKVTILIVTHNMQQAARVSDYTAYMYLGEMIEFGGPMRSSSSRRRRQTEDYITGRFG